MDRLALLGFFFHNDSLSTSGLDTMVFSERRCLLCYPDLTAREVKPRLDIYETSG